VRNSLQIVSSYVSLERNRTADPLQRPVRRLRSRIRAIALVHERLYEAGSTKEMDLRAFMEELIGVLTASNERAGACRIELEIGPWEYPKMCIDLGSSWPSSSPTSSNSRFRRQAPESSGSGPEPKGTCWC
jgi:hypothetical protein